MSEESKPASLGIDAAYQLSDVTKTTAQYQSLTPRWLTRVLEWKGLETGIIRVGTISSITCHWMPQLIKGFKEKYPNVQFLFHHLMSYTDTSCLFGSFFIV